MATVFESLELKFSDEILSVPIKGITVLVGPNNSGKSLILREFERLVREGQGAISSLKIVKDFRLGNLKKSDFDAIIGRATSRTKQEGAIYPGNVRVSDMQGMSGRRTFNIDPDICSNYDINTQNRNIIVSQVISLDGIRLDGKTRFNLVQDVVSGDLLDPPDTIIKTLFSDDAKRIEARNLIHDAISKYLIIDPTFGGHLRIRLSEEKPPADEQSLNSAARLFHSRAQHINEASDGVQAYVGIIAAVVAGRQTWILLDEPEAFLHPPLARMLGFQLAKLAHTQDTNLLVATHSADFLMGCLDTSTQIRTLKLEYQNGKSRAVLAEESILRKIYRTPLLRSTNVIGSLFYEGIVVTESDNDRVFYGEIYQGIEEFDLNIPDIIFVNAQNKQTMKNIVGPLREIGVPAAAIIDIDILKDGGKVWADWLSSANVPEVLHHSLSAQRDSVKKVFDSKSLNMTKQGGLSALDNKDREGAAILCDTLEKFGVFPVRGGELEDWLKSLMVPGRETTWTINIIERLGTDRDSKDYVKPGSDDVWNFMRNVMKWITDTERSGME